MTDLPTRLEGAAAGSRELDALIYDELFPRRTIDGHAPDGWPGRWPFAPGSDYDAEVTPVTTSIDAAVALAERVGVRPYLADASIVGRWKWMVVNPALLGDADAEPYSSGVAKTPALALCAAIIRAHAEQVQG